MGWNTVTVYKKYAIVHGLNLNQKYNIEEVSGYKFKNPTCFYTIVKIKSNSFTYSADIIYELQYPYITFKNKGQNIQDLTLDCIFYER